MSPHIKAEPSRGGSRVAVKKEFVATVKRENTAAAAAVTATVPQNSGPSKSSSNGMTSNNNNGTASNSNTQQPGGDKNGAASNNNAQQSGGNKNGTASNRNTRQHGANNGNSNIQQNKRKRKNKPQRTPEELATRRERSRRNKENHIRAMFPYLPFPAATKRFHRERAARRQANRVAIRTREAERATELVRLQVNSNTIPVNRPVAIPRPVAQPIQMNRPVAVPRPVVQPVQVNRQQIIPPQQITPLPDYVKYPFVTDCRDRNRIRDEVRSKNELEDACFSLNPVVPGYVYVPKGNVYITRTAKKYTKELGKVVYIVRNTSKSPLGIQVPEEIHEKAVEHERLTREDRGYILKQKEARQKREALQCLEGMFGKMPEKDREDIVAHTMKTSSGRVGRTQKICLPERLRLATIAHLRHNHTDYEKQLLKISDRKFGRTISKRGPAGRAATKLLDEEKHKVRKAVSSKIKGIWKSWDPPIRIWESLKKADKREYIEKVKAKERQRRRRSDYLESEDDWVVTDTEDEEITDDSDEEEVDTSDDSSSDSDIPVISSRKPRSNRATSSQITSKKRKAVSHISSEFDSDDSNYGDAKSDRQSITANLRPRRRLCRSSDQSNIKVFSPPRSKENSGHESKVKEEPEVIYISD
ncbi:hypothetical protein BDD12DRAFT_818908 [Trichophaea hybrida]|nr:hypothetical protein BDD12DRAFT_818908 [Trichophaea hybrida]